MFEELLQPSRLTGLSANLYEVTQTESFAGASFAHVNIDLLNQFGIEHHAFISGENLSLISGNRPSPKLVPISTIYAGHQFGIYTSKLGDGRVHIIGDIRPSNESCWEIQLKGAGATPFARGNNGHMSLAEAIIEYLGCEAMSGLGIPGTRGLALIDYSGNRVNNEQASCQSILIRTAETHLRFGHFEYLHNQGDISSLKELADHVIAQHYPELMSINSADRYLQFLYAVTYRTAKLLAQWQSVGFVHSVMNTDNMSIIGITMDFGVYGFMQGYNPNYSPNENDDQDRYAFDQQVDVARWNCLALAEALTELLPDKRIPAKLLRYYRKSYAENYQLLMQRKLGLLESHVEDAVLINSLLGLLRQQHIDYTRFFRLLCHFESDGIETIILEKVARHEAFRTWFDNYRLRLASEKTHPEQRKTMMLASNPKYILRQSIIDHVVHHAEQHGNFNFLHELLMVIQSPFEEHESHEHLA